MLFIMSQNPLTSERGIYRLLPAIKLSASNFQLLSIRLRYQIDKMHLKFL